MQVPQSRAYDAQRQSPSFLWYLVAGVVAAAVTAWTSYLIDLYGPTWLHPMRVGDIWTYLRIGLGPLIIVPVVGYTVSRLRNRA